VARAHRDATVGRSSRGTGRTAGSGRASRLRQGQRFRADLRGLWRRGERARRACRAWTGRRTNHPTRTPQDAPLNGDQLQGRVSKQRCRNKCQTRHRLAQHAVARLRSLARIGGTDRADSTIVKKRKSKRSLLLSVASAGAVASGCASVTDTTAGSQTPDAGYAPGLVVQPIDSGSLGNRPDAHVVTGLVPQPRQDAGHILYGVMVQPPPDGGTRIFPGVIARLPDAGLPTDDAGEP
jgi:hypothetical protein